MRYLFYLSKSYSIAIIQPLARLLENEGRDFALYVSERVKSRLPQEMSRRKVFTSLREATIYHPHYVIVPGNFVDYRIPGVKVQVFHGLGVEKEAHFKNRHFFDVYLTSGPYVTQRFMVMRQKNPYFEVIETGWLKMDAILSFSTENIRAQLGIPEGKKVILYAPTFSRTMQSSAELARVIPKIIKEDEFWLFKFHTLMPRELIAPFKELKPQNCAIFEQQDISICLHASDLMISDTSSVVYEFIALGKPVITYKSIAREDKAYDIRQPEKLRSAIDYCITRPEELMQRQAGAIAEVNPYLDGTIARRTLQALDSLDPASFPHKGKPLNLFRKAQIHFHSIFKKGYLR